MLGQNKCEKNLSPEKLTQLNQIVSEKHCVKQLIGSGVLKFQLCLIGQTHLSRQRVNVTAAKSIIEL